jgi:predicted Zn-dependent protease with MMP-like domain
VPVRVWSSPAPSLDDIAALAEAAFADLPAPFRAACGRVVFRVADFADEDVLDELGIEDPFDLTGLCSGAPVASDLGTNPALMPSEVWLYRRPILDEWAGDGSVTLEALVRHVLIHEIGHHLGLSDDDIEAIEHAP